MKPCDVAIRIHASQRLACANGTQYPSRALRVRGDGLPHQSADWFAMTHLSWHDSGRNNNKFLRFR